MAYEMLHQHIHLLESELFNAKNERLGRLTLLFSVLQLGTAGSSSRCALVFDEVIFNIKMHEKDQQRYDIVEVRFGDIGWELVAFVVY